MSQFKIDYNAPDYRRSRGSYMAQCTVEYFVSLLVTDAFLAKLLTHIGISDALTGVISSFITLAFVFQLLSIPLVKSKISTKKIVMFFDTMSISFFMFLYFIPFLPVNKGVKTVLVVLSVLIAYVTKYLILSLCFKWANAFVEPTKRARYSANKEIVSLVTGIVFTFVVGWIIDKFEGPYTTIATKFGALGRLAGEGGSISEVEGIIGNLEGAFLFIAIGVLILNICNFICLKMIKKEDESEHAGDSAPFKEVLRNTTGNRNFRSIIVLTMLWDTSRYFIIGFLGTYKTKELLMSMLLVQIVNICGNVARVFVSKPIAKYSDKTSFAKGMKLGMGLEALAFLCVMFTTPETWWLIIVYTVLHNCATAGTNQNSFNIAYSYVDSRYITQAMAIKNSIGGLCGFGAAFAAGKILAAVQANGNTLFGIGIYGQQILAAIALVILVVAIVYTRFVIEKQQVMVQ